MCRFYTVLHAVPTEAERIFQPGVCPLHRKATFHRFSARRILCPLHGERREPSEMPHKGPQRSRQVPAQHIILETCVVACAAGVPLPCGAPEQLPVDSGRRVTFRGNHVQSTKFFYLVRYLDIRATPGHVCSDRYRAQASGTLDNRGLVVATHGIYHAAFKPESRNHFGQRFAFVNILRPNKHHQ